MSEFNDSNDSNDSNEFNDSNEKTVRTSRRRGVGRPRRFTREEARAIRKRKNEGNLTFSQLKQETGVSVGTLQQIVRGTGAYANTL